MESTAPIMQTARDPAMRSIHEPLTEIVVTETITDMEPVWPIHWSAVVVGTLSAAAVVSVFGFIGIAIGAHQFDPANRGVDLRSIGFGTLALSIFGAFLSFVVGGWVAVKIAGMRRSEPAMLHGAIVWLVAVPMLYVFSMLGAGSLAGGWFAGLAAAPDQGRVESPFDRPEPPLGSMTNAERERYQSELADYQVKVNQWRLDTPKVIRNTALGSLTAILLGLMGAVIGGWMASGQTMTLRSRPPTVVSP